MHFLITHSCPCNTLLRLSAVLHTCHIVPCKLHLPRLDTCSALSCTLTLVVSERVRCISLTPLSDRGLGFDQCMIHHMMYHTSIDVYPSLPVDLESIVLLLASILFAVIVTAELDLICCSDCTGKLPGELYIIVKTCFACAHFLNSMCAF